MDFGFYYDPSAGLLRGGAWTELPPDCNVPAGDVFYTCHHYGHSTPSRGLRATSGSRAARCRRLTTSRCGARSRRRATGLAGGATRRGHAHVPRRRRLRGPLHLSRHEHRPDLGRQHVRGSDGAAARARGAVGPRTAGASTTRSTSGRRSSTARTKPTTGTGGSRPRTTLRRLSRVRRRPDRPQP